MQPCTNVFQGSFTIQSSLDINTIAPYCEITGNLTMSGPGLTNIALPALQKVGGSIDVSCTDLASLDLGALAEAGSIDLAQTNLTTLNLASLATVGGDFRIGIVHQLTNVTLPELTMTSGAVYINGPTLVSVALPKLTHVGGNPQTGGGIVIGSMLTSIDLGALTTVMRSVSISLASGNVSLPALSTVATDLSVYTTGTVSVPLVQQAARVDIKNNSLFSAPALKTITKDFLVTDVAAFNLGALTSVGGNLRITGPGVTALPAPQLATIGGVLAVAATKMTALDFPALTSIGATMAGNLYAALDFDPNSGVMVCNAQNANSVLTQLKLPLVTSLGPTNSAWIRLGDQPMLPKCRIDAFVAQLVPHGWTGMVTNLPASNPNCHVAAGPCP